jgi:selenoprotein W-related protein
LAAEIKKKFGLQAKLVKGQDGIFDVEADGKMLFSKHEKGRFPETDEVLTPLSQLLE